MDFILELFRFILGNPQVIVMLGAVVVGMIAVLEIESVRSFKRHTMIAVLTAGKAHYKGGHLAGDISPWFVRHADVLGEIQGKSRSPKYRVYANYRHPSSWRRRNPTIYAIGTEERAPGYSEVDFMNVEENFTLERENHKANLDSIIQRGI